MTSKSLCDKIFMVEYGNPLKHRSLQLGLRGEAINKYVEEWIVNVTDITHYVLELKNMISAKKDISELLPDEKVYQTS